MAFINLMEIIDIIIMSLGVGYIFMDMFLGKKPQYNLEGIPVLRSGFDWNALWFSVIVTAPALVLHEFGHKLSALAFGYSAEIHASYVFLAIAIALKLMGSPILFFVPAYAAISGGSQSVIAMSIISFSGPLVNLVIWLGISVYLKYAKKIKRDYLEIFTATKKINKFLFFLNMVPLPFFDGWKAIVVPLIELFKFIF